MTCGLSNGYIISVLEEVQQEIICKEITIKNFKFDENYKHKDPKISTNVEKCAHHTHTYQLMSDIAENH